MEKTRMTEIHSQDTLHFIRTHRREDVRLLALQAHRYPSVDIPAAITQISGWQIAREDTCMGRKREDTLSGSPFSGAMLLRGDGTI